MTDPSYITPEQAAAILDREAAWVAGDPEHRTARVGIAHIPTAETRLRGPGSEGGEDVALYGEEVNGELVYAYDLATGQPVKE